MKKRDSKIEVIVPGESAWELWRTEAGSRAGSALSLVRRFESGDGDEATESERAEMVEVSPAFSARAGETRYGIPSSDLTVVPLWIQVPEQETEAAVAIQLEARGIKAPPGGKSWYDYREAKRDGGRRLVIVTVLGEGRSALGTASPLPESMQPAADFLALRPDRVTLFRELGTLVLAVTQGAEVVFQSPLVAKWADEDAAREIVQIIFQLQFDGAVDEVAGLDVWVEGADVAALSGRTGLQVEKATRPEPVIPAMPPPRLVTGDVAERRETNAASARVRKIALVSGAVVSALIFGAVVASTLLGWKRDALREEIAGLSPRAAAVAADKGKWEEIAPAVDRDRFALEILHRLSEVRSVRGVTLTKFEMAPGMVIVSGSATKPGLALKFGGEVTAGEFLPDYQWEFPAPVIAADNTATFVLKGTKTQSDETQG